jgi:hypothetical protein
VSAGPAGLPPRRELPRDVTVPVLPGLGTTWYDRRGAGYWGRRAGLALLWLFLTAVVTLIVVAILDALSHRSTAGFTVVLVLEVAYSLAVLAFFAVTTVRGWDDPHPSTIRPGNVPGQVFVILSSLTIGLYLALLLTSLLPETPAERHARLQVAGQLRGRGHAAPGT